MVEVPSRDRRSLHQLLEAVIDSHKHDIHDYSRGHLNESNLAKPRQKASHQSWKSAKKKNIPLLPQGKYPSPSKEDNEGDKMKATLASFSLGTAGNAPLPLVSKPKTPKRTRDAKLKDDRRSSMASSSSADSYAKVDDGVLVEELKLPEVMLRKSKQSKSKVWAETDLRASLEEKPPSQGMIKDRNLARLTHQFMPSYHEGVTKKDQFQRFKDFESEILRKQDANEQNVMTGVKAVDHLEWKLQQELDTLPYNGYGPNFHRLQVFSNIFDELISESSTFGYQLKNIKKEYDEYVACLLDNQSAKHQLLHEQVEQLSAHGATNPRTLELELTNVHGKERNAKKLLEDNERLRREVQAELDKASEPEPDPPKKLQVPFDSSPQELVDQVEELHATILEKLDNMNGLRSKLRSEYVPSTVCTHLEQCIKETEVDIQKLRSEKNFFDLSIADMEKDLDDTIAAADTTERDARKVWKKVSAVKAWETTRRTLGTSNRSQKVPFDDSDNEQDEESKWNWYIS